MVEISVSLYSVADDIKPEEEYGTILVFSDHMKFCDTGFFDGCNFKLWGRHKGIKHSDITHWAYMPKVENQCIN